VAGSGPAGGVSVLLGQTGGRLGAPSTYPDVHGSDQPLSLAIGDLNADGFSDVVVADGGGDALKIFRGNGDGTLQPATSLHTGIGPEAVLIADVNLDGKMDLVDTDAGSNMVSVHLGTGTGDFGSTRSSAAGQNPEGLAIGDFDLD